MKKTGFPQVLPVAVAIGIGLMLISLLPSGKDPGYSREVPGLVARQQVMKQDAAVREVAPKLLPWR